MALNRPQVSRQVGGEGVGVPIAEKYREAGHAVAVGRQTVRLHVVDHLQAVLQPPQKAVVVDQCRRGRGIDPAASSEPAQRLAGRAHPQPGHSPAPYQLLGLSEEFDLADAAAAGLDVVAFDRDPAAAAMGVDLPLDRVDVLDCREIEVLAPDKGPQLAQEPPSGNAVAGDRAGLDQRRPLPVLADALIISHRRRYRHRRRGRGRVRAQPQIDAKHVAVAGAFFEQPHQIAREPAEKGLRAFACRHPRPRGVVKQYQVDIARIVELAPAELAQAEHDQPAVALRIVRLRQGD